MKRYNYLHEQICHRDNIELADKRARKHKSNNYWVKLHDRHKEEDNLKILQMLSNLSYATSLYKTSIIYEPKERVIWKLPYYPDRITHHAIMNILEPIWINIFIKNTYSCIKGRGILKCRNDLFKDLQNHEEDTKYCLKLDIKKFYPSINHDILKSIIRKKIKDQYLLRLLDEIIDSAPGVPIGNYLSLFFANLYLAYFDHYCKETLKCKYYYRYADDIVVLSNSKLFLHFILSDIKNYLKLKLELTIKSNYQIYEVDVRGIDFIGYVFRHKYVRLRKSIKLSMYKLVNRFVFDRISKTEFLSKIMSYKGWLKYCNSRHLANIILCATCAKLSNWDGEDVPKQRLMNKCIYVIECEEHNKYYRVHCVRNAKSYTIKSTSIELHDSLYEHPFPHLFKL